MSAISANHIARAIYDLAKDKSGESRAAALKSAVEFIARKKMLGKTESILSALDKIISTEENSIHVKISSPKKLSESEKHSFSEALRKRYRAEHVRFSEEINENLLSGARLQIGDDVIDLSAKNKITQLKEYLIK